jgi:hypothetical protein
VLFSTWSPFFWIIWKAMSMRPSIIFSMSERNSLLILIGLSAGQSHHYYTFNTQISYLLSK